MSELHTAGPWRVAHLDKHGQAVVKAEHIEVATCWHHCVGSIEKEMRANARLIAAAPELLDALSKAIEALRSSDPNARMNALRDCPAVVAKATGEEA